MNESTNELWKAEKRNRKRIFVWISFMGSVMILSLLTLATWISQPIFSKLETTPNSVANSAELKKHVETLSVDFYPRNHLNVANLDKTADYIKSEFSKTNGKVSEQEYQVNNLHYRNLICKFGSSSGKRIIIGAHYDSAFDTPGADDNASGIAGLIELAKLIDGDSLNTPIELVAYSLEEPPYFATEKMGSYQHAKSLRDENQEVDLMISLEMIGYFSDEPNSQKYPFPLMNLLYPATGNFILITGTFGNAATVRNVKYEMSGNGLDVYSANIPTNVGGTDLSDHRNYWKFGFDATMITDTAYFRNRNYHTKMDTFEKLDYSRMAKVVEGVFAFLKSRKSE
jgi:Zn-dependent M28 family amino/carboxypeptidase